MLKNKYILLKDIILIIIFLIIFIIYFGNKYIKKLNTFIIENNSIIIKNDLNDFINSLTNIDFNNLYIFQYNEKKEVVGAEYNSSYINKYLISYTKHFKEYINKDLYNKHLSKFYKKIKLKNKVYLLVPMGIISDNPFIYNFGPNIFLSYDYLTTYNFNLEFDAKNYGLNNILVNIYLVVNVDQSIFKPVLKSVNNTKYKFLLSSSLVYGRVSNFLTNGINMQSLDL